MASQNHTSAGQTGAPADGIAPHRVDQVGPELPQLLGDAGSGTSTDRDHRDDSAPADDDAEGGEHAPKQVGAEGSPSHPSRVEETHSRRRGPPPLAGAPCEPDPGVDALTTTSWPSFRSPSRTSVKLPSVTPSTTPLGGPLAPWAGFALAQRVRVGGTP